MNDLNIPPCSICGKYHPGYCCVTSLSSFVTSQSDIETLRAEAYRAGRIAQAEEDAEILREQLTEAKRPDQRMTLAIAIRAIERGRNLTETEKMKNLMGALAESDRADAAKIGKGE